MPSPNTPEWIDEEDTVPSALPNLPHQAELQVNWGLSALLIAPGLAVVIASLYIGLFSVAGIALFAIGLLYLAVEAFVLQPRFAFQLPGLELEHVALEFSLHRQNCKSLEELATRFQSSLQTGLGIDNTILVLQGASEQICIGGGEAEQHALLCSSEAVDYMSQNSGISTRDQLSKSASNPQASAALRLLDEISSDVLMPFSQEGQLLGFATFSFPWKNSDYGENFLEVIGQSMTSGLIHQHLQLQAQGREAMAQTFALAQAMQNSLLPDPTPVELGPVRLQGWSKPAEQCGGDLWAWHDLGEGQVLLFVGDATGHGVSPATLAAVVSGSLAAHANIQKSALQPEELLGDLNSLVREVGRKHHMMSAFTAILDSVKGEIRYANAGHNPPFLWRHQGDEGLSILKVEGSMLGSADTLQFKRGTKTLCDQDVLFLYTDGITEAGEPHLPPLGNREFRKILKACSSLSISGACQYLEERVVRHLGDMDAGDDMTFVVLRYSKRHGAPS